MLKYHNINELEGKVAANLLDSYKVDYKNPVVSSIIGGFHRAYGLRNEGISMSLEIVNSIKDDTENLSHRNILVWNLHILSGEYIDEGIYDGALSLVERAEKNWTRDVIMGDDIGVYHVSWIEQIWQRQAEICLLVGDKSNFKSITDKIIACRLDFFNKAEEITGESILKDRCTYNCLELIAFDNRKNNVEKALEIIKQAILIKAGYDRIEEFNIMVGIEKDAEKKKYKLFDLYLKYYFSIQDQPFDNKSYTYCKSCKYYSKSKICNKNGRITEEYKACSQYNNLS
jgi:hypothetical protein